MPHLPLGQRQVCFRISPFGCHTAIEVFVASRKPEQAPAVRFWRRSEVPHNYEHAPTSYPAPISKTMNTFAKESISS
jgi:hypothetical protein